MKITVQFLSIHQLTPRGNISDKSEPNQNFRENVSKNRTITAPEHHCIWLQAHYVVFIQPACSPHLKRHTIICCNDFETGNIPTYKIEWVNLEKVK